MILILSTKNNLDEPKKSDEPKINKNSKIEVLNRNGINNLLFQINNKMLDENKINASVDLAVKLIIKAIKHAQQNENTIDKETIHEIAQNHLTNERDNLKNLDELSFMLVTTLSFDILDATMNTRLDPKNIH
jgi:hypothetical protein